MCGRYRLSRRKQIIEEYFETADWQDDWSPRYNIAPTQPVPVIRQNPKEPFRELSLMRWGLIPSWAKEPSGAAIMINARSETATTKLAFADALKHRRCLIPADGFYEWKRNLTTIPNAVTSAIHDRMPVILNHDAYDVWLDPGMQNVSEVCALLKPYDPSQMRCYPVSTRINHVANDDEACSQHIRLAERPYPLFS